MSHRNRFNPKYCAAAWPLNGHTQDVIRSHDGGWVGTSSYGVNQYAKGCANLSIGNYITVADHADIKMGLTDFTITMWIMLESFVSNRNILSKGTGANPKYEIIQQLATGALRFQVRDAGASAINFGTTPPVTFNWHHYAFVCPRGGTLKIYRDSLLDRDQGSTAGLGDISNTDSLQLSGPNVGITELIGKLFDVRMYSCALSRDEVIGIVHQSVPIF